MAGMRLRVHEGDASCFESWISIGDLLSPPALSTDHNNARETQHGSRDGSQILLERAQELSLLRRGLVGSVTELGRSVDPFEVDLLQRFPAAVREHRLAEGHHSLLDAGNTALEHDEVVLDLAVADETTQTREC